MSGNYDPATNLLYWGVGNGGPWMGDLRPGDNLYISSTIAIDASTGKIVGHFQYNPNESFDWDEVSPPLLIDYTRNGQTVSGLVNAARGGYMFFLERSKRADRVRRREALRSAERVQERRSEDRACRVRPRTQAGRRQDRRFLPDVGLGAKNWQPAAFDPGTRLDLHPDLGEPVLADDGIET